MLLSRTLYLFLQVALCNQPTGVYVTESDIGQGPSNHAPLLHKLLVLVL